MDTDNKIRIIISSGLVVVLAAFFFVISGGGRFFYAGADKSINTTSVIINDHRVSVEIASMDSDKSTGLSNRDWLDKNAGMLFIYNTPATPGFWMKEMKFSIDIIWIYHNKVSGIEKNVPLDNETTTYTPSSKIDAVLEVNAGWAEANDIKVGDKVLYN